MEHKQVTKIKTYTNILVLVNPLFEPKSKKQYLDDCIYCTSDKFLPIGWPEMHHMIAPYQTIVYPLRQVGCNDSPCEP